jgi:hypothetical protein
MNKENLEIKDTSKLVDHGFKWKGWVFALVFICAFLFFGMAALIIWSFTDLHAGD